MSRYRCYQVAVVVYIDTGVLGNDADDLEDAIDVVLADVDGIVDRFSVEATRDTSPEARRHCAHLAKLDKPKRGADPRKARP